MAGSFTGLTAAQIANQLANRPLLMATHLGDQSSSLVSVWWDANGDLSTFSDDSDPLYPIRRATDRDGSTTYVTKPATSRTPQYMAWDFGASGCSAFDSIVIVGHDFTNASNTANNPGVDVLQTAVSFQCSDTATFPSNATYELQGWSPPTPAQSYVLPLTTKRLVSFKLYARLMETGSVVANGPISISGYRYFRLRLNYSAGYIPKVSEVWFGSRCQLTQYPLYDWDPDHYVSKADDFRTRSGRVRRYTYNYGARNTRMRLNPHITADVDALKTFFALTEYGTKPFIFVPEPKQVDNTTIPYDARIVMMDRPELGFPHVGVNERRPELLFHELPPFTARD